MASKKQKKTSIPYNNTGTWRDLVNFLYDWVEYRKRRPVLSEILRAARNVFISICLPLYDDRDLATLNVMLNKVADLISDLEARGL